LQLRVNDLEFNRAELHDRFEVVLVHLEKGGESKDTEIESANREIERLSVWVWGLEEELGRTTDWLERKLGEVIDCAPLHEESSNSLKDVSPFMFLPASTF
jgi:hypothetical protein